MDRSLNLALLAFSFGISTLFGQGRLIKLPSSPADANREPCNLVGEVLRRDLFAQTFVLSTGEGQVETLPYSRWTGFFKITPDSRGRKPHEIDPAEIRKSDLVCAVLDPSGATAKMIFVIERGSAPTRIAGTPDFDTLAASSSANRRQKAGARGART